MDYTDYIYPINNLPLKKFVVLVISIQLTFIGLIFMDIIGINIPILREVVGFIYLTFIPGLLILRILKLNNLNITETFMYALGLSLSFLMFLGFLINIIYPIMGINNPISLFPLLFTINSSGIILLFIIVLMERKKSVEYNKDKIILDDFFSKKVYILTLIPFLSIIGAYFTNYYNQNILLFILIFILSLVPIIVFFIKSYKKEFYPLIIFICGLSLLLHWSLISTHIVGGDIQFEYYFSNLVINSSHWNLEIQNSLNGMLSIVMIAPIYSILLNIDLNWVFKIIYPFIYAFVPLGLYQIFQKQFNSKIAFLSVFYFIFVFPFFSEMLQLARQEIAELFLVLIILILVNKIEKRNQSILIVIFGFSLAVSHYGLSYIFLILLGIILLITIFNSISQGSIKEIFNKKNTSLTLTFAILFFVFAISWYMYISSAKTFMTAIMIFNGIYGNAMNDLFESNNLQGVSMVFHQFSLFHTITKYLYLLSQGFIVIGFLNLFFNRIKLNDDFKRFAIAGLILLGLCFIIPNFASSLNTTRLFHISLILIAPFCVIGAISILKIFSKILKIKFISRKEVPMKLFSIFLMIFLLFTSGFAYEIFNDEPMSIALSTTMDAPKYNTQEIYGAVWATDNIHQIIASDYFGVLLLADYNPDNITSFSESTTAKFLYLRTINIKQDNITITEKNGTLVDTRYLKLSPFTENLDKLYTNGGSEVYFNY